MAPPRNARAALAALRQTQGTDGQRFLDAVRDQLSDDELMDLVLLSHRALASDLDRVIDAVQRIDVTLLYYENTGFHELKAWMKRHKVSIKVLAARSSINASMLKRLLRGDKVSLDLDRIDRLSRATDGAIGIDQVRAYERRSGDHK